MSTKRRIQSYWVKNVPSVAGIPTLVPQALQNAHGHLDSLFSAPKKMKEP